MTTSRAIPQTLQCPKLKLLDRSLASYKLLCDFPYASLVDETSYDHEPLIWRKAIDQLRQKSPPLKSVVRSWDFFRLQRQLRQFRYALPTVAQDVAGDSQKPCYKRAPTPLEAADAHQGLMKNVGGQVLGFFAAADSSQQIDIHSLEVAFIELGETRGILLRRLDQEPLVVDLAFQRFQTQVLRSISFCLDNAAKRPKSYATTVEVIRARSKHQSKLLMLKRLSKFSEPRASRQTSDLDATKRIFGIKLKVSWMKANGYVLQDRALGQSA
jgi:hypothetical protein